MRALSSGDRSFFRGLLAAMIVGVGGSLALAASCLGRDRSALNDDDITTVETRGSERTSAGGVPGEGPVGATQLTQAELPSGGATTPAAAASVSVRRKASDDTFLSRWL